VPSDYPISQLLEDMITTFRDAAIYIVPAAILVATVAFVIAWFMDSIDIAGRSFGRHR